MRAILRTASIRLFALLALLAMAQAGFAMNNLSLVNAASYETVSVSGVATGVVAPGSIGALFSAGMASSATFAPPGVFPLPNVLAGANVTVAGIACPLMYVSATQVNLQIPFGVATGTQPVQVFSNGTLVATGNVIVADWNATVVADPKLLQPDGIHPSMTGQHAYAAIARQAFADLSFAHTGKVVTLKKLPIP